MHAQFEIRDKDQTEVHEFVLGFVETWKRNPSLDEIENVLGFSSRAELCAVIDALRDRGLVTYDENGAVQSTRSRSRTALRSHAHGGQGAPLHFVSAHRARNTAHSRRKDGAQ